MGPKKEKLIIMVGTGKTAADVVEEIQKAKLTNHEVVVYIEEECQNLDPSVREVIAPFMMEMRDMLIEEPLLDPDPVIMKPSKAHAKSNHQQMQGRGSRLKQNFNVRGQGRRR